MLSKGRVKKVKTFEVNFLMSQTSNSSKGCHFVTDYQKVKSEAAVYMAAVLEYIVAEVANFYSSLHWFIPCPMFMVHRV